MNKLPLNEAIKIVEKFNFQNRFRDGGKINNAIDVVLKAAKDQQKSSKKVANNANLETAVKIFDPMEYRKDK